jgi:hypothetical protein
MNFILNRIFYLFSYNLIILDYVEEIYFHIL